MDPRDKNELRIHTVEIVERLEPGDVIHNLYEDGIMSDGELTQLSTSSATPQKERCRILLGKLSSRGPKALLSFVSALIENGYSDLANRINLNDDRGFPTHKRNGLEPCDKCAPFIPKLIRDSGLVYLLKKECCLFYNLDPIDFLDFYYQEKVFDENTCEIVKAGSTRLERCKLFYKMLCQSPLDKVISVFKMALRRQIKYKFIYEALGEDFRLLLDSSTESFDYFLSEVSPQKSTECIKQSPKVPYISDDKPETVRSSKEDFRHNLNFPLTKRLIYSNEQSSRRRRTKKQKKYKLNDVKSLCKCHDAFLLNPSCLPSDIKPNKRIQTIYDNLKALIYNCQFETFEERLIFHQNKYNDDPDITVMLTNVKANKLMYVHDYSGAMQQIKQGLYLLQTTNVADSSQIQVELLAAAARIHLGDNNVSDFNNTLDDAKMIANVNPNRCKGLSVGKLFFVEGRKMLAEMQSLSLDGDATKLTEYVCLQSRVMKSLRHALSNYWEIDGEVGIYSRSLVQCVMVIVLLCCGENGSTMNVLEPRSEDITQAGDLLFQLDNSDDPINYVLRIALLKAKCDYFFRRNNLKKAEECVTKALLMEEEQKLTEFVEHSRVRLREIRQKINSRDQQKPSNKEKSVIHYVDTSYFADESDSDDKND